MGNAKCKCIGIAGLSGDLRANISNQQPLAQKDEVCEYQLPASDLRGFASRPIWAPVAKAGTTDGIQTVRKQNSPAGAMETERAEHTQWKWNLSVRCHRQWCYVDPCTCNIEELPKVLWMRRCCGLALSYPLLLIFRAIHVDFDLQAANLEQKPKAEQWPRPSASQKESAPAVAPQIRNRKGASWRFRPTLSAARRARSQGEGPSRTEMAFLSNFFQTWLGARHQAWPD